MRTRQRTLSNLGRSLRLAALAIASAPVGAATITVDETCSLVDAITAAETDTAVGTCTAGSDADEVVLNFDVLLASAGGSNGFEPAGLPQVTTAITISGNGHTIARDSQADAFLLISVAASGNLELDHVILQGGSGVNVGGIENGGTLKLVDSTVSNNTGGNVGGIFNAGTLEIRQSLIAGNTGGGNGGGIFNYTGTATLVNTTISGNSAAFGGGFNNSPTFASKPAAVALLDHCTLSGNSASVVDSQILNQNDAVLTLTGSILWRESGGNCSGNAATLDGGHNFGSDSSCAGLTILTGFDSTLRDNGGPSLTHALAPDSNAVDAGGACEPVDQRELPRDAQCDSGAFEYQNEIFADGFELAVP